MSKIIHFLNLCDYSLMDGGENAGVGARASGGRLSIALPWFPPVSSKGGTGGPRAPVSAPALCGSPCVTALATLCSENAMNFFPKMGCGEYWIF